VYHKDVFIEQLVTRKMDVKNALIRGCIALGVFVVPLLMMYVDFLAPYSLYALLILAYFGYRLFKLQSIEYEYIVTNGDLDVDIIRGKSKRKRLLSVSAQSFEAFGKVNQDNARHYTGPGIESMVDAASSNYADGRYFAAYRSKEGKRTVLFIEPNEKVLGALLPHVQRTAKLEK